MLEAKYEAKLEFPAESGVGWGGGGVPRQKTSRGGGRVHVWIFSGSAQCLKIYTAFFLVVFRLFLSIPLLS